MTPASTLKSSLRVAAVISWLCRHNYWEGRGLEKKLKGANASLRAYLKDTKQRISLKRLTVENLVLKSGKYPEACQILVLFMCKIYVKL